MTNTNFDFPYVFEKILEPLFRQINNVRVLSTTGQHLQELHDDMQANFFAQFRQRAQWNSTKLAFEFVLNQEFNPNNPQKIYISNTPNTDLDLFLFKSNELFDASLQVFVVNDSRTDTAYPTYAPFNAYSLNEIVRFGDQLFFARIANPPFNSIADRTAWLPVPYVYTQGDFLSTIDFIVYVPNTLNNTQTEREIRALVERLKLYNTAYELVYYS